MVVPKFSALAAAITPPLRCTKRFTSASPSPVPFPGSFVVKYGSNMRNNTSIMLSLDYVKAAQTT
jgi:hypothetical protein